MDNASESPTIPLPNGVTMQRSRSALLSLSNLSTLILCILIFSTLGFAAAPDRIAGPIVSSQLVRLSAGVPMRAQPQYDQGPVDPSLRLGYMTLLTVPSPGQQKAINQLLAQQQDPHSPQYHQWLTPEQYADRFGLSSNDIQKLTTWLQSQGFTVVRAARARNFIVFSGTAAQAETAFQTQIHKFDINGEKRFSNITPPSIPAALTGIVTGIRGLSNFPARSHARHAKPNYTEAPGQYWIAPGDITTMYDLQKLYNAGITGAGYTLAVMGETDVYLADLNDFRTVFGLPQQISGCTFFPETNVIQTCDSTYFQYVLVTGDNDPGAPNSIQDDLVEADIDLEWSNAVAQDAQDHLCERSRSQRKRRHRLLVLRYRQQHISGDHPELRLLRAFRGEHPGAFASDEAELAAANSYGITFMNSSGDDGATECEPNGYGDPNGTLATLGLAVSYPASSQYVTGVGGTMIPYTEYTSTYWSGTNGPTGGSVTEYVPEQGWNDDEEYGAYCIANPSDSFCTTNNITSWQTAQAYFGIGAGGGGASNCTTVNADTGVCISGSAQPSYQAGLSLSDLGQTTAVRFSPDVSLLASTFWPGFIVCTPVDELKGGSNTASICANGLTGANGFFSYGYTFGGTSIASPMFAGIVTLLNQDVVQSGLQTKPGLGNINTTLYTLAATPANGAFNLLASSSSTGSNGVFCETGTPNETSSGEPGWPPALVCPAAVSPATEGFLGYSASKFDATTNYNLVTGLGSVDAYNLAQEWVGTKLAASATAVTSSENPSNFGDSVTFTATVTTTGTIPPTGNVTFYDGTTSLGTEPLTTVAGAQVATFTTSTLAPPTQAITAAYAGDTNNAASTSGILTQTINPPTFTFSTPTTPAPVLAGESTTSTFTVSPAGGAGTFVATVTFPFCSGLPDTTVTCSVNTGQANSTQIAAGSGPTLVTLTLTTTGPNTAGGNIKIRRRADSRSPWLPLSLPLAGVVMVGFAGRKMSKYSVVACLCVSLVLLGLLVACGSSSAPPVGVSVSPEGSTLFPNDSNDGWPSQTASFTAMVTNSTQGVTWSISPSTGGSITPNGLTVAYTAPTIAVGLPGSATITATSQADSSKVATATVTITPATVPTSIVGAPYSITVTASEGGVASNTTSAIALTVK